MSHIDLTTRNTHLQIMKTNILKGRKLPRARAQGPTIWAGAPTDFTAWGTESSHEFSHHYILYTKTKIASLGLGGP